MTNFIRKPSIDLYPGVQVDRDTVLEFHNDNADQTLRDLVFHSVSRVKGDHFESTYDTTIQLEEGDVLIFEPESRGYIKPVETFMTIQEAIRELTDIQSLG